MRPLPHHTGTANRALLALCAAIVSACATTPAPSVVPASPPPSGAVVPAAAPARGPVRLVLPPVLASLEMHRVVPLPSSVASAAGAPFVLSRTSSIVVPAGDANVSRLAELFATMLRPATGFALPIATADTGGLPIVLSLGGAFTAQGAEGYTLAIDSGAVRLSAARIEGLARGIQTIRQLLPAGIEAQQSSIRMASAWSIPAGRITDRPRFAWRGGMLDVSRHFFTVDEVKQYIDLLALYKLNVLHLHLSDDQGWRIQIDAWPRLATLGGSSEVGGGAGGYYTKADYSELVRYAGDRYIMVVPEIDMPAHINAAVAAYPELGCGRPVPTPSPNAASPALYTGIRVGWSALCVDSAATWRFIDDVVREVSALTPGPYFHMGGDEVEVLTRPQYVAFVERVQRIVAKYGKTLVGWEEIGRAGLAPSTLAQQWRGDTALLAVRQGNRLILSPGPKAYLDQRYAPTTELGLNWAGFVSVQGAYDWNPATYLPGLGEENLVGIEAPLWTETVKNISAAEYLLIPRLPALAEVGWTANADRSWESFRGRIAAHAPRWRLLGVNYYASPEIVWDP